MQVAHKIELKPNNAQRTYFAKASGVSRFSYNWGLKNWQRLYEENKNILVPEEKHKISGMSLKKAFNGVKKEQYPWVFEVTKYAAQQPFLDLDDAFKRFFKKQGSYPKPKKKGKSVDSFYVGGDQVKIINKKIHVPKPRLCQNERRS
jgi:putative transposase